MAEITKPLKVGNVWTNLISKETGASVNFEERDIDVDGTTLNDARTDGVLYRKLPASEGSGYVIDSDYITSSIINVKRFGAVGDQVADDTAAIQNAINSAPRKGIIFFPAGVYNIYETLVIPNEKELIFQGVGRQSSGGGGWGPTTNGISHLVFYGTNDEYTACIESTDTNFQPTFKYLNLTNASGRDDVDGIRLSSTVHGKFDTMFISGFRRNIFIDGNGWYAVFDKVTLRNAREANFYMTGLPNGLTFRDSRFSLSDGDGVRFEDSRSDVHFKNCYFEHNQLFAINLLIAGVVSIDSCHFESNGVGIEIPADRCQVRWRRHPFQSVGTTLNITSSHFLIPSGINVVGSSGGDSSSLTRMRLLFQGNHIRSSTSDTFGNQSYALYPISGPTNVTAVFIGNTSDSGQDNDLYYPKDTPTASSLFSYSTIGCGLSPRVVAPATTREIFQSGVARVTRLYLAPAGGTDGGLNDSTVGVSISSGTSSPEGIINARPSALYIQNSSTLPIEDRIYIKESGTGNTGWRKLKTTIVKQITTGDANDFEDGSIYSVPQGSAVSNLPTGSDGFVFTYLDSESDRARQLLINRRGLIQTRSGASSSANRYADGWIAVLRNLSGSTTDRPTLGLTVGTVYFDTDLNKMITWDGSSWITNIAVTSGDTASPVSATYDQAEVQAILDELRDLKTKMRAAGLLAT